MSPSPQDKERSKVGAATHAELFGQMKETVSGSIEIHDMEPSVFEAFLHLIYTDALPDTCDAKEARLSLRCRTC